jgi:hypothetical protein
VLDRCIVGEFLRDRRVVVGGSDGSVGKVGHEIDEEIVGGNFGWEWIGWVCWKCWKGCWR